MGFTPVALNESTFTSKELAAINELRAKRRLSSVVTIAIKRYLNEVNPEVAASNSENDLIFIKTEDDIINYLKDVKALHPDANDYGLKLVKNKLIDELKEGAYTISKSTGEHVKIDDKKVSE